MFTICAEELSITLTELVNCVFKKNRFPDDMKRAEISPIFKKNKYKPKGQLLASYPFSPKYSKQHYMTSLWNIYNTFLMICYMHIERNMVQSMYSSNSYIHGNVL